MKFKYLYILIFLSVTFFSCNQKESKQDKFDYGTIKDGVYRNDFFNFSMKLPTNWVTLTEQQNQNLMNAGTIKNTDPSKITTVILMTASQFEIGKSDSVFNANMLILAENIKGNARIRTASDYLMLTRQALEKEPVKREYPEQMIGNQIINGTEFSTMRVVTTDNNKAYSQNYYTSIIDDFAVTAILTYSNEEERILLENSLGTFQLK